MVHSIGEVAIEVPGGTEHCLIPIRLAPIGVCARVAFTRIRLDLGNSNGHSAIVICALKQAAEDFGCDVEHLAGEEPSVRQMKSIQRVHLINVSAPSGLHRAPSRARISSANIADQLIGRSCRYLPNRRSGDRRASPAEGSCAAPGREPEPLSYLARAPAYRLPIEFITGRSHSHDISELSRAFFACP